MVFYRVDTVFDHPPDIVKDYIAEIEKRIEWDGQNFDKLEDFKILPMHSKIIYVKLKS